MLHPAQPVKVISTPARRKFSGEVREGANQLLAILLRFVAFFLALVLFLLLWV